MKNKNISLTGKTILVTGAAGFIGANLILELLRTVPSVHLAGIDNMNDYYDVRIKEYRLAEIEAAAAGLSDSAWTFLRGSIADKAFVDSVFQ